MMNESKRENKALFESLKEEMLANYRGIDQKFNDNQSQINKQSIQIDSILKEVKNLQDRAPDEQLRDISESLRQI